MAYDFNGTSAKIDWGDVTFMDGLGKLSIHLWANADTISGLCTLAAKYNSSGGQNGFRMLADDGSEVNANSELISYADGTNSNIASTAASTLTTSAGWQPIGYSVDNTSATGLKAYVGGTAGTGTNANGFGAFPNIAETLRIGASNLDDRFFDGQLAEFAIWNRVLSGSEWTALAAGDSPIVAAPSGLIFYARLNTDAVDEIGSLTGTITNATTTTHPTINYGSVAYTLTLGGGSYAVSGAGVTLTAHQYTLVLGSNQFNITGANLNFYPAHDYTLALGGGTYSTTGSDLTGSHNIFITLLSDAYAVTGADLTTTYTPAAASYTLVPDAASYVLTGADLTTTRTVDFPLDAETYAVTGGDVLETHSVFAPAGVYGVTGADVTFVYTPTGGATPSLVLDGGTYAVTGADLAFDHGVTGDSGVYTVTGEVVTLTYTAATGANYSLVLGGGTYSVTGGDIGWTRQYDGALSTGTYTIIGGAVTLTYTPVVSSAYLLVLDGGGYTHTGNDLIPGHGWQVVLGGDTYAVTGGDVTWVRGTDFSLGAGSYAITGSKGTQRTKLLSTPSGGVTREGNRGDTGEHYYYA